MSPLTFFILLLILVLFLWVALLIIKCILSIIIWLLDKLLVLLGVKKERSYKEMRGVFAKFKNHKFHTKVLKSNSPGLSGLWHQLLTRVNFDIPTAERIINGLKLRHPGKSDRWLIEKAIRDLDRDRRR